MKIKHNNKIYDVLAKNTDSNGTYYTFQNDFEKYVTVPGVDVEVIDGSPVDNAIVADKLKDIELSIETNRYSLNKLYVIKNILTTQCTAGEFEFGKLYKFYDVSGKWVDTEIKYYGLINSFDIKDKEFLVHYSGIYNNLVHDAQDFADCQIGGFDADGMLYMHIDSIDAFIKNCEHISEEEYNEAVKKLCNDIQERSKYWIKENLKK